MANKQEWLNGGYKDAKERPIRFSTVSDMEIEPLYVDVAIRRWQRHTGDRAIHSGTGKCFDELAATSEVGNGQ